jgi:NAD(P)-dependent dehydrogenase (short-subunit alcohol dehydrogenase family)
LIPFVVAFSGDGEDNSGEATTRHFGGTAMTSLAGRTVLITGAATGIGAASARLLAEAGADVGINYCHSKAAARKVLKKVQALGRPAALLECDVCDPDQVTAPPAGCRAGLPAGRQAGMVARFVKEFGRIDVLFANAGGLVGRCPIARTPDRPPGLRAGHRLEPGEGPLRIAEIKAVICPLSFVICQGQGTPRRQRGISGYQ